tara:strand:- start:1172 stop:1801 length:630 start_codon:yes stop_codon:yes gene_type:complete
MATARLTAYGATAKGSGYADADDACEATIGGTQLLASDDGAVFAHADDSDENTRVYLAKVASVSTPSHLYAQGDGYAAGQKVYVPEQTIGGIFGAITTAGYYTVAIDGDTANAAYITTFGAEESFPQPTECPVTPYVFGTDAGAESVINPAGCTDCKDSGPVISRMEKIRTNYGKRGIDQVPFSLQTAGPFSLKFRDAYRVTTGDKADE